MSQVLLSSTEFAGFTHYLRSALPYLEEFHHQCFVIQLDETILQPPHSRILEDILLLHRVGIRIVLVHGAQTQIIQMLEDQGVTPHLDHGILLAKKADSSQIHQCIASLNWSLLKQLKQCAKEVVSFSGHFLQAEVKEFKGMLLEHRNGSIQDVDTDPLQHSLQQGFLPVLPPFAINSKGQSLLLDPNEIAQKVAVRLRAKKVISLVHSSELEALEGSIPYQMTPKESKQWFQQQTGLSEALKGKFASLAEACERGVERCHLLNHRIEGSLLAELLTSTGVGTMITNTPYQRIRTAQLSDIPEIFRLLQKSVRDASLIHRSVTYIEQYMERFQVFCVDDDVLGCCEMIPFCKENSVELASLTVDPTHRNQGIGRALVLAVLDHAKQKQFQQVFALSQSHFHVFVQCGLKAIPLEALPQEKMQAYDSSASQVYGISL